MNSTKQSDELGDAAHAAGPLYYDLAVIRTDTTQKKLTGYPMTHEECCVMKSKFSEEEQSRIIFVPAHPVPDPDHGPIGNQEAELNREIVYLKEKLSVAQSAQENVWKANIGLAQQLRDLDQHNRNMRLALGNASNRLASAAEAFDKAGNSWMAEIYSKHANATRAALQSFKGGQT